MNARGPKNGQHQPETPRAEATPRPQAEIAAMAMSGPRKLTVFR